MLSNMTDNESRCAQKCLLVIRYATHASCAGQRPNKNVLCLLYHVDKHMQDAKQIKTIKTSKNNGWNSAEIALSTLASFAPFDFQELQGFMPRVLPKGLQTPKSRETYEFDILHLFKMHSHHPRSTAPKAMHSHAIICRLSMCKKLVEQVMAGDFFAPRNSC